MKYPHHELGDDECSDSRRNGSFVAGKLLHGIAVLVALAAFTAFEPTARATMQFPGVVETTWHLSAPNLIKAVDEGRGGTQGCLLCHSDEVNSGLKMPTTNVGKRFFAEGLGPDQTNVLKTLLARSKGEGWDSDGDGVSDYDELQNGTDPNVKNAMKPPPPPMVTDGGVVVDAGFVPVTEPEPEPQQKLPPLLQTGCSVSHDRKSGGGTTWTFASLALLALLRRRATKTGQRRHEHPAIHV